MYMIYKGILNEARPYTNMFQCPTIESKHRADTESGLIISKSSNSNPGATEQPTRTLFPSGSAACQKPAGMTWQNVLVAAERVTVSGMFSEPSQM